jgi:hypothetical protein
MIVVSIELVFESYVAKGYQAVRCLYVLRAPTSYKLALLELDPKQFNISMLSKLDFAGNAGIRPRCTILKLHSCTRYIDNICPIY